MRIQIRNFSGKRFDLHVLSHFTIWEIKQVIQDHEGIPPDQQILISNEKRLKFDEATLADFGVYDGAIVYLILTLRGS